MSPTHSAAPPPRGCPQPLSLLLSALSFALSSLFSLSACEPDGRVIASEPQPMSHAQGGATGAGGGTQQDGGTSQSGAEVAGAEATGGAEMGGAEAQLTRPAPARLARLTRAELIATLNAVFAQAPDQARFEVDSSLHGFVRVASGEVTISPLLAEQLEAASWELAGAVTERAEQRVGLLGCDPTTARAQGAQALEACLNSGLMSLGGRLWRRPLKRAELSELTALFNLVSEQTNSAQLGLQALISALIQSPHTLFRVELGEPHPTPPAHDPERLRYSSLEMASRLSYLLWGEPPDEELARVAREGLLTQDEPLRAQVERLLASPKASAQLALFFDEALGLERLSQVSKDPTLFPELTPELLSAMRREVQLLFERFALSEGARFDELFTTDQTFVNAELASIYALELPAGASPSAMTPMTLNAAQERGGLLGRAALMTLHSHAAQTSPTLRGRLIRSGLLCQDVPPPPMGVVTELPPPSSQPQTLRERLSAHSSDPVCAGCHRLMDPLGFPLEAFDPLGRSRDNDNGLPLDLSGDLDGLPLEGARELGVRLAESERLGRCVARRLYRYATAHLESLEEEPLIDELGDSFNGPLERHLPALITALVMSEGFREATPPEGAPPRAEGCTPSTDSSSERCDGLDNDCDGEVDEGLMRRCLSACGGEGFEVCLGERGWSGCEAPLPPPEVCDGVDNDCDGDVDEEIGSVERCDQRDDDCDGVVDEDSTGRPHPTSYDILSGYHEGCSTSGLRYGNACHAAINRLCQAEGCGATGYGPAETSAGELYVICLEDELLNRRAVSYAELTSHHPSCEGRAEFAGPNCNAAIHRYCSSAGLTTGFGPLEHSGTEASVVCVPSAEVIVTTYTDLQGYQPRCSASNERIGSACQDAIHARCVSAGFRTGWGPLENNNDTAVIACLP